MANIQPKRPLLDPNVASRVSWVHGNLYAPVNLSPQHAADKFVHDSLTEHLPFGDGYFHHVRAMSIAKGVPENKVRAVQARRQ